MLVQWEFHTELQNLLQRLQTLMACAGCATAETVQACESVASADKVLACSGCANTGMAWLAQCAQQAIVEVGMDSSLLQESSQPRQIAKAYDAALAARPASARAAHLIKDLLVLKVCTVEGPWTNKTIKETMTILFDRKVDGNMVAQVLLAYNSMFRAATDRQEFNRAVSIFDEALGEAASQNLLAAYISLRQASPDFQSNAKAQRKASRPSKKGKAQAKELDPADLQADPRLCLDLADLQTGKEAGR